MIDEVRCYLPSCQICLIQPGTCTMAEGESNESRRELPLAFNTSDSSIVTIGGTRSSRYHQFDSIIDVHVRREFR